MLLGFIPTAKWFYFSHSLLSTVLCWILLSCWEASSLATSNLLSFSIISVVSFGYLRPRPIHLKKRLISNLMQSVSSGPALCYLEGMRLCARCVCVLVLRPPPFSLPWPRFPGVGSWEEGGGWELFTGLLEYRWWADYRPHSRWLRQILSDGLVSVERVSAECFL